MGFLGTEEALNRVLPFFCLDVLFHEGARRGIIRTLHVNPQLRDLVWQFLMTHPAKEPERIWHLLSDLGFAPNSPKEKEFYDDLNLKMKAISEQDRQKQIGLIGAGTPVSDLVSLLGRPKSIATGRDIIGDLGNAPEWARQRANDEF